jgi:hypothetical protein
VLSGLKGGLISPNAISTPIYRRSPASGLKSGLASSGDLMPRKKAEEVIDVNTILLTHFDAIDGIGNFVEETGKILVPSGSVSISTAESVFNGKSAFFTGSNARIDSTLPAGAFSNPFTVEMRVRFSNLSGDRDIFGTTAGGLLLEFDSGVGQLRFKYGTNNLYVPNTLSANVWYAFAFVFTGTNLITFIDGIASGTISASPTTLSDDIIIGTVINGRNFLGYMDELRVRDVAEYITDYTVAVTAFTL